MIDKHLKTRGIKDERVLRAFAEVPRHLFVDSALRFQAYQDHPLPIGHQQTISQPYVVAAMVQSLRLQTNHKVLDIGTGCGYQAAILARLCRVVYSIERIPALVHVAKQRLDALSYHNVIIKLGDGFEGWQEFAPYDAMVTAAWASELPEKLFAQLKVGGRLVMPIGDSSEQQLTLFTMQEDGSAKRFILGRCAFVPMVGRSREVC